MTLDIKLKPIENLMKLGIKLVCIKMTRDAKIEYSEYNLKFLIELPL